MSHAPRPHWTPRELAMLRELYPHQQTAAVAAVIGRPTPAIYRKASELGLRKTREWIAVVARERTMRPGHGSHAVRFQPGHTTWNKGVKGSTGLHANTKVHHYKAGSCNGRAAQLVLPLGTLRVSSDGILERKFSTTAGGPHRRWRGVHRLVWEATHGPVPAGHVVVFRPGRKTTDVEAITLDAVELVTRGENMRRNSVHSKYPPELARLVQLRGALNRVINRKAKQSETTP